MKRGDSIEVTSWTYSGGEVPHSTPDRTWRYLVHKSLVEGSVHATNCFVAWSILALLFRCAFAVNPDR